ncbi:MAG: PAS domain-containing protein [Bdellovibrio sp.]
MARFERMKRPLPTVKENPFAFDEFFFSTTDERGVILFGNDVFVRVSGYAKEVLKGAPHSIIRHPDMPRAVFKLLWNTIQAGDPIAAYVKNLAANGNFYWVLAFVFPIEGGYISIRVKPSSALFEAAQQLYVATLDVEAQQGMEGSIPFLLDQVGKAGFRDYGHFMVQASFSELSIIREKIAQSPSKPATGVVGQISDISHEATTQLKDCFQRVVSFQDNNQAFIKTMESLEEGFRHLKYIALNMTIAAAKFGEGTASLGVVAKEFSLLSTQIQEHLRGLHGFIENMTQGVQKCAVRIVALDTQMLMVDFFIRESIQKMATSQNAFEDMVANKEHFSRLFRDYSQALGEEVGALDLQLGSAAVQVLDVRKFTTGLEVIRQIGAVESARENEVKQTFIHYLDEMKKFISLLQTSTAGIHKNMQEMRASSQIIVEKAAELGGKVEQIFNLAASIGPGTSSEGAEKPIEPAL